MALSPLAWLRRAWRDRRGRFEREVDEELASFLAMASEDAERQGCSKDEAARRARLSLGGIEQARERLRAERRGAGLETLAQDVRYGFRILRRQPGFTLVALLTLALGIGATTAVLSVVRTVLLAPLPFAEAEQLVRLRILSTDALGREQQLSLVPAYFHAVRARSQLLERAAAQRFQNVTLTGGGEPERVVATGVSDGWMETLGVQPLVGRGFSAEEQRQGSGASVLLIGHGFWQRRFGGDAGVLGTVVGIDGRPVTIIGVMAPGFRYPYNTEAWFPMSVPLDAMSPGDLNAPARMRRGVGVEALDAELSAIGADLARELPGADRFRLAAVPMRLEFQRDPNRSIAALAVAVAVVLLLACVNLATLLMARGGARAREMALRTALGAGRLRQVRQLLTESVLLALGGGLLGAGLAFAVARWLGLLIPPRLGEVVQRIDIDGGTLAASAIVCIATGLVFGLVPALALTRSDPGEVLKAGGRPGGEPRRRALDALVVAETGVALVLLVAAGLMAQNFVRLLAADVGYAPAGLTRVNLALTAAPYADPRRRSGVVGRIVERVEAVPGVAAAGVTSLQPIPRTRSNLGTVLEPDTVVDATAPLPVVNRRLVTPGYFAAMGVRLVRGRGFSEADGEGAAPVAIVNQSAADRFWPGEDPVGRRVRPAARDARTTPWHTVVGVVGDMGEPDSETMPETIYQPYAQANASLPPGTWITTGVSLMVRTVDQSSGVMDALRRAVHEVDPAMPLYDVATMDTALAEPLADQRLGAAVFAVFGAFGLLMAVLGTYGVLAFTVSRRVPEFGVRLALGATPRALLVSVLGHGLARVGAGLALGAVVWLALSGVMSGVLSEVSARDPVTIGGATLSLLAAGILACWLPAWRATRVDAVTALRGD